MTEPTIREMIEVMEAAANGRAIEHKTHSSGSTRWNPVVSPNWNWGTYLYRVKQEAHDAVPWPALDDQIKYVARDEDGSFWGFTIRPKAPDSEHGWTCTGENISLDGVVKCKAGPRGWRDTLQERPA